MATNTYVALDKVTVGTATPSVTFSAIGAGYTDLVIVFECFTTAAGARDVALRFNSDTGSNYSSTFLQGNGTSAVSARESSQTRMMIDYSGAGTTSATAEIGIVNIMNYSNATTNKTVLVRANRAGAGTDAVVGLWRNTAAITSVTLMFINGTDNFGVGSVFSLYGILAEGGAKATGGYVTSDANYYYHTFLASGTFTPKSTLSCDVLVVAGGGGGGAYYNPGGGGAGGLLGFTSQSISTATNVTVGAGGNGGTGPAGTSSMRGITGNDSQFGALTLVKGGGAGTAWGQGAASSVGNGGSGGGAVYDFPTSVGTATSGQGYNGGQAVNNGVGNPAGGGGGAGGVGGNGSGTVGGAGGVGSSAYSSWGLATSTGQLVSSTYYYAGGGGGSIYNAGTGGTGGNGGGGNGGISSATAGTANTGGGGGACERAGTAGGKGGSGIVIVRYAKV